MIFKLIQSVNCMTFVFLLVIKNFPELTLSANLKPYTYVIKWLYIFDKDYAKTKQDTHTQWLVQP